MNIEIDKEFFESGLSLKSCGLLFYLITNREFEITKIAINTKDKTDAIRTGLNELVKFGFLTRIKTTKDNGTFGSYEYVINYKDKTYKSINFDNRIKREGIIYFIKNNETKEIKIGKTKSLLHRMAQLTHIETPNLKVIHTIESMDIDLTEALFHNYFFEKRIKKEWFKLTKEDMKNIKENNFPNAIKKSLKGEF